MPASTITFFNSFKEAAVEGMDLGADTFKVYLTNTAPNVSTHTAYDGVTGVTGPAEIAAGGGYTAGGNTAAVSSAAQTAGTFKLVLADPATWTGSGGGFGPFRYAVLYDSTPATKWLVGYYDYGSSISLAASDTLLVDLDPTAGVLTLT